MRRNNTKKEETPNKLTLFNECYIIGKIVLHEWKMSYMKPIHAGQMSYMSQKFSYTLPAPPPKKKIAESPNLVCGPGGVGGGELISLKLLQNCSLFF